MFRDAIAPGSPISFGNSTPSPRCALDHRPAEPRKSRAGMAAVAVGELKMYFPRAIRSGVISTLMFDRRRDRWLADHHVARARDAAAPTSTRHDQTQNFQYALFIRLSLSYINATGARRERLTALWDNF